MKVGRCVVLILPVALLASCVAEKHHTQIVSGSSSDVCSILQASCVYAEEDCTAVNAGDVCSMLQDKLQSALLQNPTNLYKIRKAFRNPVPSIISVEYEIDWNDMTTEMCYPNTTREFTNSTIPCNTTSNYMYLWTSILYFTTISPGFLQHLQLQTPYFMVKLTRFIEPIFGEVDKDYNLNAILWDGCSTRKLLSLQLFLKLDTLPCTPSERLLESSIQELTTWLQAYTDVWPQGSLKLDVEKKFYAISHHAPARYSEGNWKVITGITLTAVFVLFCIGIYLLYLIKQYFLEDNNEIDEDLLHPMIAIFISNMYVLIAELWAIYTTCSMELLPFLLKTILFVMLNIAYFLSRVIQYRRECGMKRSRDKVFIINFLIQWNLFLTMEFFIAGVVPAALLAIAYPIRVVAIMALLTTGLIFYILFWTFSLRILHELVLKDCQRRLPFQKGVCECFFFLFTYVVGIVLIITLLAILAIGILKGTGNIYGPLSFLPSGVFSVLSWLTPKFNKKRNSESNPEDTSEQTRTRNDMTS